MKARLYVTKKQDEMFYQIDVYDSIVGVWKWAGTFKDFDEAEERALLASVDGFWELVSEYQNGEKISHNGDVL